MVLAGKNSGMDVGRFIATTGSMALLVLVFQIGLAAAEPGPLPELHTAEQVRRLTPGQAESHYPVRLRGVLTFCEQRTPDKIYQFIQDDTAGIYFYENSSGPKPNLATGEMVELQGVTGQGEFAPVVLLSGVEVIGPGNFPEAKPVSFEQLTSGQEDSQFVEVRGMVRSVERDEGSRYFLVEIATGGGRLTAYSSELPVARAGDLVDSMVKVRGVCLTQYNSRHQLFDIRLLVPRSEDLVVETTAPSDPFGTRTQKIGSLLQFTPDGTYGHRVKVAGVVIYRQNDNALYIQDGTEGLYVETRQRGPLLPGDRVEVLGFPAKGEYTPMLQDAIFRKRGSGLLPKPDEVTADGALSGTHDCRLVRITATVLDRARKSRDEFLVLQAGGFIFQAYLERQVHGTDFSYLQNGSEISVTGVCVIEKGADWFAGEAWRAKSFRILMRSPGDIFVLRQPPWWTLERLIWVLGAVGVVMLAAFAWVAVLRRRVRKQTGIIRQQLQTEASLKERYKDLFENANDVVFTHDLSGRITSINQAGERLLQRPRNAIINHGLLELVAEEERAEAGQWLEQVVKGAEMPPSEWDFMTGSGQRLKVEISSRMVGRAGKSIEVEGIARDITERKRLEKEILEVSNREQRRMGHDLHDGVCQQLAGVAYLTDILADGLDGKGDGASAAAQKISRLINESITQTRTVARGLFPVRLEENGLVSALEEFAANASSLYKIDCRFDCGEQMPALENGAALHLYYIVQESVLNAVKHGKAAHVNILLAQANGRMALTVDDDGEGFQMSHVAGPGMGIRIMRYRARVINATLDLKSQPGHGTQVTCGFYPGAGKDSDKYTNERINEEPKPVA